MFGVQRGHRPLFGLMMLGALMLSTIVGAGMASAQTLDPIKIASIKLSASAPVYLAKNLGYFKDAGLDASYITFDAAQDSVIAAASGSVTVGVAGFTAAFYNVAGKGGLKVIAGQTREATGFHNNGIVVTNAAYDAGFTTPAGMKGKRVGITTAGGPSYYIVGVVAQKYGFDLKDITIVPLQNIPNLVAAFKGGQIDAMVAGSPVPAQMETQHIGHIVGWAGDEVPWQFGGVFTSPGIIQSQRPVLEKFLVAYGRASAEYNKTFNQLGADGKLIKGPDYQADAAIIARELGIAPDALPDSWPYVDPDGILDAGNVATQVAFWQAHGFVDKSVNPESIVDRSFGKAK